MAKTFTILLLLFCQALTIHAQYDNVWAFGYGAGIDFNVTPPIPITTGSNTHEGTAMMCDKNGNLLLYTDGYAVWNKNHGVMPNGYDLPGFGTNIIKSSSNGAIIIPFPDHPDRYYVFSLGANEYPNTAGMLFYSVVDMSLNNGLGDVISGQKGIVVDSLLSEHMSVVSGNNCDVWLVVISRQDPYDHKFKVYNISINGIDPVPTISDAIEAPFQDNNPRRMMGSIDFSIDRSKIAVANKALVTYDFNSDDGSISNPLILYDGSIFQFYGCAFSFDGSKLYGTYGNHLIQYNLGLPTTNAVINSKTIISDQQIGGHIRRAPDGKLYTLHNQSGAQNTMNVVNSPNLPGQACDFGYRQFPLMLGTSGFIGLPNAVISRPKVDTTFSVNLCEERDSWLTPSNGNGRHYLWSTGDTSSSLYINTPGTYWVTYRDLSGSCIVDRTDTFIASRDLSTGLSISNSCRRPANGSVHHIVPVADSNSYDYVWVALLSRDTLSVDSFVENLPAGDYQVRIANQLGCDTTIMFTILEEHYQLSFESDTIICEGDEVWFNNTSSPYYQDFYWAFGDGGNADLQSPRYIYNKSGAYKVMLSATGEKCQDTVYKTILVDAPVNKLSFVCDKHEICIGENISFTPEVDSAAIRLHWSFGEYSSFSTSDLKKVQHAFDDIGELEVQLTASFRACPDISFSKSVDVYPYPEVDLGTDSAICLHGSPIYLENLRASPTQPYRQVWNTGDTTATLKVVHPGNYSLSVTIEPLGCTTTESVQVNKDCYIDIPNAFTPNGDGYNDYFFPRWLLSENVSRFKMQLFNRWGQIVFETTNQKGRGWDGQLNNQAQPMGIYLYRIEVGFFNGGQEVYQGNVTLIR